MSLHKYAFNSDLERLEKMVTSRYATKNLFENLNDRIGDFVKREDLALI